ncbi:hypothetical protein FB451DRAFT_1419319 [Mycena latifolia]|nr:hypothetical protein FB451DRAFT_1419319 [Mycena latifolia]
MVPISALPPGVQIAELSGPLLIGYLLHWGLFGTLSIQLYLYYEAFPRDRLFNKCLVYTLYLLELVQTILMTHDAFAIFGSGFGDLSTLKAIHFAWFAIPIMSGIVALISQSFYAYRLFVLSKSRIMPVLIVIVALASSVGGFVDGSLSHKVGAIPVQQNIANSVASGMWLVGAAVADILIAVSLTYYLSKHDTGFRHTHALVTKLMRVTIETGSLTAVVALVNAAVFFAFPGKPYFFTAGAVVPKLYSNTVLAVLNSRFWILGGRGDTLSHSQDIISIPSHLQNSTVRSGGNTTQVAITREVFSDRQLDDLVEMKHMSGSRV